MTTTPASNSLGPITPIHCPMPDCHWSCHGVPEKYANSRAQILSRHVGEEHTTTPEPTVWSDSDPLMEAIAAAVWEQCATENSIVVDDPRTIAAVAATVARQILGTTTSEGEPGCAHCGRTDHVWETCEAYTAAVAEETDEEREQREDREDIARNHAAGDHQHCGVTCEVEMPTDHLRNFVIAKGYPGTAGALDELLRRAAVLHEAADRLSMDWGDLDHADGMDEARQQLRRMADEAQQPISAVTEERQQPTPRPCTDPCIACMTDESHDPAVAEEPGR